MPCVQVGEGVAAERGVRTRCYGESSRSRKACRILVPEAHLRLPQGLHVYGVSPHYSGDEALPLVCSVRGFFTFPAVDYDTRKGGADAPAPGSVLVLGPYADQNTGRMMLKCFRLEDLLPEEDQIPLYARRHLMNAMTSMVAEGGDFSMLDSAAPTPAMLRAANVELRSLNMDNAIFDDVAAEEEEFEAHRRAAARPPLLAKARLAARLFFYLAMYLYRWAGPGTPYPVVGPDASKITVGSEDKPVSETLVGRGVRHTSAGVRLTTTASDPVAAEINQDGRLGNMENAHLQALHALFDACTDDEKQKLRRAFRACTHFEKIDGSGFYTDGSGQSLFDMCVDTSDRAYSVIQGRVCVRMAARSVLYGTLTVIPVLYKSPPAWSRIVDRIYPGISPDDPMDDEW